MRGDEAQDAVAVVHQPARGGSRGDLLLQRLAAPGDELVLEAGGLGQLRALPRGPVGGGIERVLLRPSVRRDVLADEVEDLARQRHLVQGRRLVELLDPLRQPVEPGHDRRVLGPEGRRRLGTACCGFLGFGHAACILRFSWTRVNSPVAWAFPLT